MRDFSIKYWGGGDSLFEFEDENYDLARRSNMTVREFNKLMKKKFKAHIKDESWNDNPKFRKEVDIKRAIEYLQPHIDGYWVMLALTDK